MCVCVCIALLLQRAEYLFFPPSALSPFSEGKRVGGQAGNGGAGLAITWGLVAVEACAMAPKQLQTQKLVLY